MLTPERLKEVAEAAENNFKKPLDLIAIHAEQPVRGTQPRASLNPFTVMAAGGTWERLIADLVGSADSDWKGTGSTKSPDGGVHHPDKVDGYLRNRAFTTGPVTSRWEAIYPKSWKGATPTRWTTVDGGSDESERAEFLRHVWGAIAARNAAAHYALAQNADVALLKHPSEDSYPWDSDARTATLQSGYVRGAVALWLQVIDSTLVAIASDHDWEPDQFRLPADWFGAVSISSRYQGVEFWGGRALHRIV
ncbi:hypothetical protein ACIO52_15130 [Nocardia sp. NPDC087230]|uniref:hypothetical protein n=1 Tax=Nocardia sp. NPDC087230 TaxID=3364331 RepID=UPI0038258301